MSSEETDKICEKLLQIYARRYQKPEWMLNYLVDRLVKEGKTREEAILHLYQKETEEEREQQKKERLTKEESKGVQETAVERLREKIERLTVLFSNGEITEETYKNAVKTIEENIKRIQSGKEIPTVKKPSLPPVSSEYEPRWVERGEPTRLWWLIPLFFMILGGIIAYVGVKDADQDMADKLLIFSIIWSIILLAVLLVI